MVYRRRPSHRTMPRMRGRFAALAASALGVAIMLARIASAHAAAACGAGAICGLKNPEDVVRVGSSPWAIASRLARDPSAASGLYLVNLKAKRARALTADVSAPAVARYRECPGPPDLRQMITHGLDLRWRSADEGELFAVNHGGRQSVEVFDVKLARDGVKLRWSGCVIVPDAILANAVAALPDGIAVTSFGERDDKNFANLLAGKPSGFVATWSPGNGWSHVPGSRFAADNGIALAADGQALYVNGWGDGTLHILPLRKDTPAATIQLGDFHPDNVHLLPDGKLLIAGQAGAPGDILACDKGTVCPVGSRIVIVDPRTRTVLPQVSAAPSSTFGAASAVLLFEHQYWAGSFLGDRLGRLGHRH